MFQSGWNRSRRCLPAVLLAAMLASGAVCPVFAAAQAKRPAAARKVETKMSDNLVREKYEWSNIWWDCADDKNLPRVLLIGDSISVGYGPTVTKLLEGKYHVDRLSTSRAVNDPILYKETRMMLVDNHYAAIHFNNGLHGFHLKGPEYDKALREYVDLLQKESGGAKLIWAASTPITAPNATDKLSDSNAAVITRNELALKLMQERGIPVDDLYALMLGKADRRAP
ncbi:MAG TPA: SGNH/GDSL hydrolase family protein, partial [Armatimonadota bacterium]|nr:SGNH/GDSL hydrolase family protein [Armatimonadota bacterium]